MTRNCDHSRYIQTSANPSRRLPASFARGPSRISGGALQALTITTAAMPVLRLAVRTYAGKSVLVHDGSSDISTSTISRLPPTAYTIRKITARFPRRGTAEAEAGGSTDDDRSGSDRAQNQFAAA